MTIHTLKPDNQVAYIGNEAAYDEWYQTNLHLSPAQVQLNHHTYNDKTQEITFRVRPINEEVTATTLTPPPWVTLPESDKAAIKKISGVEIDVAPKPKAPAAKKADKK